MSESSQYMIILGKLCTLRSVEAVDEVSSRGATRVDELVIDDHYLSEWYYREESEEADDEEESNHPAQAGVLDVVLVPDFA